MTREDAIEVLKLVEENVSCDDCLYYAQMEDCPTDEECIIVQASRMAIQALSQEPTVTSTDEPMTIIYPTIVCDDAVSRKSILKCIDDWWSDSRDDIEDLIIHITYLPSVTQKSETVTEFADRCRECGARYGKLLKQKSGKWLEHSYARKCSACGSVTCWTDDEGTPIPDKYCPNCGARMVEPQESEDKG